LSVKRKVLESLARPVVEGLGYQFWGVQYLSAGHQSTLRLYIDSAEGVFVEDCEKVSRQFSSVLDVEDPIPEEYTLEVSSPGLDRPFFYIDQFDAYKGETLHLKLKMSFEGRRKFTGILTGTEDNHVLIIVDGEEYLFPFESIDKAHLVGKIN